MGHITPEAFVTHPSTRERKERKDKRAQGLGGFNGLVLFLTLSAFDILAFEHKCNKCFYLSSTKIVFSRTFCNSFHKNSYCFNDIISLVFSEILRIFISCFFAV